MNKRTLILCIALISVVFHAEAQVEVSSQIITAGGIDFQKTLQRASAVTHPAKGVTFFDFQKDAFGQVRLHVDNPTDGDTIFVYTGECMKDGRVDRNPGGTRRCREMMAVTKAHQTDYDLLVPKDERNTGRDAVKMPQEVGDVTPFRYVEVVGAPSLEALRIAVNVPFDDDAAYFHCDNEVLNKVWELCKHTIKATSFAGYYVDGDRERIPYEADALINQLSHYGVDASYEMARRTFSHLMQHPTWPTEWILQMPMIAWNDYMFTGDNSLAVRWDSSLMKHTLLDLVDKETGLVTTRRGQSEAFLRGILRQDSIRDIVDWPHSGILGLQQGQGGEDDGYVYTDFNTVVNAYHYKSVLCYADLCLSDGEKKMGRGLKDYCKTFKNRFNRAFLDKKRGVYRDGIGTDHASLHANMFAMAFGLVPKKYEQSVADFICSRGMACSVYGAQFLLEALYECGRDEDALQLMTSEGKRSWMNMLSEGSTMTMEAWGNEFKPNQDWNHAWGAAPANIIPFRLLGIRPLKPGFEEVEIRPQTGSLKVIEGRVPTPKGPISVNIDKAGDTPTITITAPENMAVTLLLPNNTRKTFQSDGKAHVF